MLNARRNRMPIGLLLCAGAVAALLAPAGAQAAPFPLVNNYDTDPLGQLPTGWTFTSGSNSETYVALDPLGGTNRVFQIDEDPVNGQGWTLQTTFAPYTLTSTSPTLFYQFRLYVDEITGNDSEGITVRVMSNLSSLDAGFPRILRNGTQWRFYSAHYILNSAVPFSAYSPSFNFDQWYTFRVEIDPDSTSSGKVYWYMDGTLIRTETYSGRSLSQTQNIQLFEISNSVAPGGGARIYLDNLIVGIPEPAGALMLGVGGLLLLRRRNPSPVTR